MSIISEASFVADIHNIRENYDNTPLINGIIKAKERRLKILQELNKQGEEEFRSLKLTLGDTSVRKSQSSAEKKRKSEPSIIEIPIRRSSRLQGIPSKTYREPGEYQPEIVRTQIVRPPNDYGAVPGVEVGAHWETRMECSQYGVHRPTVAGIHGGPDGAYSIALSGGYPEDEDEGYSFIYTGAGGRELKGTSSNPKNLRIAPQTKDQTLMGANLSLVKSIESKLPLRVIRGYKSPCVFAPETGYRYDGLYQVVSYWEDVGKTGHRIYRFKMERMKDQAPPPWEKDSKATESKTRGSRKDVEGEVLSAGHDEKENIEPFESNETGKNVSDKEVKEVDNEIQTCIHFFFRMIPLTNSYTKDNEVEDFFGWDTV